MNKLISIKKIDKEITVNPQHISRMVYEDLGEEKDSYLRITYCTGEEETFRGSDSYGRVWNYIYYKKDLESFYLNIKQALED